MNNLTNHDWHNKNNKVVKWIFFPLPVNNDSLNGPHIFLASYFCLYNEYYVGHLDIVVLYTKVMLQINTLCYCRFVHMALLVTLDENITTTLVTKTSWINLIVSGQHSVWNKLFPLIIEVFSLMRVHCINFF